MEKYVKVLHKKACSSSSKFKVAALGISKRGNIIGCTSNKPAKRPKLICTHAESQLMLRYGKKIDTIYIHRCGLSGEVRPIDPCPMCASLAKRFNIKIKSI